jgi:hypothetical protein
MLSRNPRDSKESVDTPFNAELYYLPNECTNRIIKVQFTIVGG